MDGPQHRGVPPRGAVAVRSRSRTALAATGAVLVLVLVGASLFLVQFDDARQDRAGPPMSSVAPPPPAPSLAPVADAARRYPVVRHVTVEIAGSPAEIHLPLASSARRAPQRYPVAVLLPDRDVDSSQYNQLAHEIGTYGLTVVVPTRPRPSSVRDIAAWSSATAADADAIGHGLVEPSRLFVVVDGRGATGLDALPWSVRAVVRHAPPVAAGAPPSGPVPVLLVCPGAAGGAATCARAPRGQPAVVLEGGTRRSITDEGGGGVRSQGVIDPRRLPAIERAGAWTAWWLLAQVGDREARDFLADARTSPPPGSQVRLPAPP